MIMEIVVSLIIFTTAGFILFKNIRKKAKGGCDCGSCGSVCPNRKK